MKVKMINTLGSINYVNFFIVYTKMDDYYTCCNCSEITHYEMNNEKCKECRQIICDNCVKAGYLTDPYACGNRKPLYVCDDCRCDDGEIRSRHWKEMTMFLIASHPLYKDKNPQDVTQELFKEIRGNQLYWDKTREKNKKSK